MSQKGNQANGVIWDKFLWTVWSNKRKPKSLLLVICQDDWAVGNRLMSFIAKLGFKKKVKKDELTEEKLEDEGKKYSLKER